MAQIVQRLPVLADLPIGITTWHDVPGLEINLLTGSGSILAAYSGNFYNNNALTNQLELHITLDEIWLPFSEAYIKIPTLEFMNAGRSFVFKPGSGQHVFRITARSALADVLIQGYNLNFIIEELGF
jgi:hypothetical protein